MPHLDWSKVEPLLPEDFEEERRAKRKWHNWQSGNRLAGGRTAIPGYDMKNPPPRKPNWRSSYERTFAQWRRWALEKQREGEGMLIAVNAYKRRPLRDLSYRQVLDWAHRMAETDLNHAIHDWNSNVVAARRAVRRGQAF